MSHKDVKVYVHDLNRKYSVNQLLLKILNLFDIFKFKFVPKFRHVKIITNSLHFPCQNEVCHYEFCDYCQLQDMYNLTVIRKMERFFNGISQCSLQKNLNETPINFRKISIAVLIFFESISKFNLWIYHVIYLL